MVVKYLYLQTKAATSISTKITFGLFLPRQRIQGVILVLSGKIVSTCSRSLQQRGGGALLMVVHFPILLYYRNSTYCLRIRITTKFVENEPNLCYSADALYKQRLPAAVDGVLVCPYLDYFKDENDKLPTIQWYKVSLLSLLLQYFQKM